MGTMGTAEYGNVRDLVAGHGFCEIGGVLVEDGLLGSLVVALVRFGDEAAKTCGAHRRLLHGWLVMAGKNLARRRRRRGVIATP